MSDETTIPFTQDDVDGLRTLAKLRRADAARINPQAYNDHGVRAMLEGSADWLDTLAAKIAALLPEP